jgi:hypothetical protein
MNIKNILDDYILEDIQNPEHPSDFTAIDNHCMLILRLPELDEPNNSIKIFSYALNSTLQCNTPKPNLLTLK